MNIVYVIGPYRPNKEFPSTEYNIERAKQVAIKICQSGNIVLCPHTNTGGFEHQVENEQFFIDGTKMLLEKCDAAVVLPGWELSVGSIGEIILAAQKRIPLFFCYYDNNYILGEEDGDLCLPESYYTFFNMEYPY